ncbi:MAG: carbon-nitrogen hydrolase family protein [Pseudomonadota bacterium]
MSRKITVGAVQMACKLNARQHNLSRAAQFIEEAARQGAALILLPELMPSGYTLTEAIWEGAEPFDGETTQWMKEISRRLGVYLGTSFLEAEGEDFYNSFVLAGPDGNILGKVRKNPPASVEAYFYCGEDNRHVIETPLGKIGISICYENLLHDQLCHLHDKRVDLLLSPAAAGRPKPFIPGDIKRFENMIINGRSIIARALGVPVITANRTGPLETELPGGLPYLKSSFPGLSSITDSDGTVLAELGEEEEVIVADVTLGTPRPENSPRRYGRMWAMPVPWYAFIWPLTQKMGERSYKNSAHRKERAKEMHQTTSDNKPPKSGHAGDQTRSV